MKSNNKKRLLSLIDILKKNSDMDHKLSLSDIAAMLEEEGIDVSNRKTLYDDFRILGEYGYEVEYDNGYYLSAAPFSLSEIKIISDSLNSLKNLDERFLKDISDKLYSFISAYEEDLLKRLEYQGKHSSERFINRLEDALSAISSGKLIAIRRKSKEKEIIAPLFLYRMNDYYYLYYHYKDNDRIYHVRFDNIAAIDLLEEKDGIDIPKDRIISLIEESTNSFYSKHTETIRFAIVKDSEYLRSRLSDDFSNIIFTKEGFAIKASVNKAFFAKIVSYGEDIKISDPKIADEYISFLEGIIRNSQDCSSRKA